MTATNTLTTMKLTDTAKQPQLSPMVYFRGVNRIHINRFKAYTQILTNNLNAEWRITDDPKVANVVIEQRNQAGDDKAMQLAVLADTANHQPQVVWSTELSFKESQLVRQLNQASKKLRQGFDGSRETVVTAREFEVCDLTSSNQAWVARLQALTTTIEFQAVTDLDAWYNDLFHQQVLLLVDPQHPRSSQLCMSLMNAKQQGDVIIEQLTVVITDEGQAGESLFDRVYDLADDATQVSTLDPANVQQWQDFVQFL
ncbi:hypothetical protein [Marinicella meishanensis]|uniref:hypothetical protein n=1 Tax=Marinicella meishanensis TaxID=2873263 RepID=UPI001CBF3B1F|nr:hypothetical protein [Marinicella sp. NBU2979]